MAKQKVYISASLEELEYEREIAERVLRELNFDPLVSHDYQSLLAVAEPSVPIAVCDVFVLIVWRRYHLSIRREYAEAVERGKPVVILVKLLKDNERRDEPLAQFLDEIKSQRELGATPVNVPHQYRHYRSLSDFERELAAAVLDEVDRRRSMTILTANTRESMYQLGTSITLAAQDRLLIAQQTPSLLLGPRAYDAPDDEKLAYEVEFHDALWNWVEQTVNDKSRHCIYFFEPQRTQQEIRQYNLKQRAKERIRMLKEYERKSGYRFRIAVAKRSYSGPMAVGDNWLALWIMGEANVVVISFVSKDVADALTDVFRQLASEITSLDETLRELSLD